MKFSNEKDTILGKMSLPHEERKFYLAVLPDEKFGFGIDKEPQDAVERLSHILSNAKATYFSRDISAKISARDFPFLKSVKPFFESCKMNGHGIIIRPMFPIGSNSFISIPNVSFVYQLVDDGFGLVQIFLYIILDGDTIIYSRTAVAEKKTGKYHIFPELKKHPAAKGLHESDLLYSLSKVNLASHFIDFCVTHFIFKEFAPVETVVISAGSKRVLAGGEKHINESNSDVIHIDSKWFRNIVRTEGFSVRGHFRLQPKKVNGEWTKELIWINEFEKSGYVSKAKMLNQ